MGIGLWAVAGVAAVAAGRLIHAGRPQGWRLEAGLALLGALAGGVAATGLDFGGWKEPDWRAGLFAFLLAFAVIGLSRLVRLTHGRRSTHP